MDINQCIYQTEEIRQLESQLQQSLSKGDTPLMQRAAQSAFDLLEKQWPKAKAIHIYCGAGNNGGDGYTLAVIAKQHKLDPVIWQVGDHTQLKGDAKAACQSCIDAGVEIKPFNSSDNIVKPDLIVDAICGIGLDSELRGDALKAVQYLQNVNVECLAIDVPTGVNADTGEVMGAAVCANVTVTYIGHKLGLFTGDGVSYAGKVVLEGLQTPISMYEKVTCVAEKKTLGDYASYLKPRAKNWHKGLSGHVLIIGGDLGFAGAPLMAGRAALNVGAGLVTVATHPDHAAAMDASCPEVMCHGVHHADELQSLAAKADVIVIGPGLGQSAWSMAMWSEAMLQSKPLLVDADGLNLLASNKMIHSRWVLTPHPGEAARLLGQAVKDIQQDRLCAVQTISERYQGVCVLKGAGTLVAGDERLPTLCDKGNPGMATAGMGDILSGVIGALIAQKLPLLMAAQLGVQLHACAGDLAAKEGERGMVATDLLPYLRQLSNVILTNC